MSRGSVIMTSTLAIFISLVLVPMVPIKDANAANIPPDPDTFLILMERQITEDETSAAAYYAAIDPGRNKTTYADWLFETGFIDHPLDYSFSGPLTDNADAAVVHKNVTDLGLVRRMRVRCEPGCDHPDPDIYTVIENYLSFDDAAARVNRLTSVAMEWVSAKDTADPSSKFVLFYAFNENDLREVNNSTGAMVPFAPDLDGRGSKVMPGVCNTCHGGAPEALIDEVYAEDGNTGALFLPLDLDNFAFDPHRPWLSREAQEPEYKKMNRIALITHRATKKFDEEAGFSRLPAGHELIEGWYGGPGLPDAFFNGEFVPPGWLPPFAPNDAKELYLGAIAPACRACHAQQERSLDFGTYQGLMEFEDALQELVLRIECGVDDDSASRGKQEDNQAVMPLALETYEIFWETNQHQIFKDHIGEVECED